MFNFKEITNKTQKYNFHSHTPFCDGKDTMEAFIVEAIAQGFTHYGFSPHSPIHIESPCNMTCESVDEYLTEVKRLQKNYGNKINIYASMEIDYTHKQSPSDEYFQKLPLDYRIGSIHFIPSFNDQNELVDIDGNFQNFKTRMEKYFNNDIEGVVRSYYKQSLSLVELGGFDIIGHCDKIGLNANFFQEGIIYEPWYEKLVLTHIESIMDYHYTVEINTKAWKQYQRLFPHSKYFSLLKKYDAPVVFNSDAHYAQLINAGRQEAMEIYTNS